MLNKRSMSNADSSARSWEDLFWTVFNLSTNPIALFDEQRVAVEVNAAMCELLGASRDELIGLRLDNVLTSESRDAMATEWRQVWQLGQWSREPEVVRFDGTRLRVQAALRVGEINGRHLGVTVLLKTPVEDVRSESDALGLLTPREREVVRLVALGHTSSQIAEELVISTETVRTHVRNAMKKTGAHTRAQLVANALADRHIDPGVH